MDRDTSIRRAAVAAATAKQLEEPFMILEASYFEQIMESASDDTVLREHIYHRMRVLQDMKIVLSRIVADGQIAEAEVIRLSKIESGELKEFF